MDKFRNQSSNTFPHNKSKKLFVSIVIIWTYQPTALLEMFLNGCVNGAEEVEIESQKSHFSLYSRTEDAVRFSEETNV